MASPAHPPPGYLQPTPSELPVLQDELLEEIFLRLPTAADLARASIGCPTFRRVITDHPFLRRFRTLHPPPLLGIISATFHPAQPPHPSAAAARAFADADIDFRCSFLPSPEQWSHRDFRDGRALLSGVIPEGSSSLYDYKRRDFVSALTTLAVCDPLHRGYLLLPAIPDELAALVHQPDIVDFEPFLAPPGEDEDDSSFRVICLTQCTTKLVLFVFSSGATKWHAVTYDDWIALVTSPDDQASGSELTWSSGRYYAHKCFCWAVHPVNKLLMLDTRVMEFSAVNLPPPPGPDQTRPMMAFVETVEGRLGMFTLNSQMRHGSRYYLRYAKLQNEGAGGENQWRLESIISVPLGYRYTILGVAGGYLLLQGIPEDLYSVPLSERPDFDCFSLNLQTLQLEWFCANKFMIVLPDLYAGFPPSLSPPTV